jgi:hypothetical protein
MDTLSVFILLLILLVICVVGLINAETLFGVFVLFLTLTFVSYMNIYLFKIDNTT